MAVTKDSQRRHAVVLMVLLGLFCFRVFAQLLQWVRPVGFLPGFDRWASGALPYPLLFGIQIIMIGAFFWILYRWFKKKITPSIKIGVALSTFGGIYFLVMFTRLIIGLSVEQSPVWFQFTIPSFFHLVLASFFVTMGTFHLQNAKTT
ncbi:MAG: hypothetical protein AAGJ81_14340 [Verrucomicrobiota bacterium]